MKDFMLAVTFTALMLACIFFYVRASNADELAWQRTCEAIKWQTRCNALESQIERGR